MGERKVQNWYFPPDWDPTKIPRHINKRDYDAKMEVRMMLPFNMCCRTCGHYMYRGKKFNSKKENAKGEDYLGIRIIRFYIKCEQCHAQITFKTDPKNGDYTCESGASRNFEVWRATDETDEKKVLEDEPEEVGDAMTSLESKTLDSKIEMDILDALDEIKALNQAREKMDVSAALERVHQKEAAAAAAKLEEVGVESKAEEDAMVERLFRSGAQMAKEPQTRRLEEDDNDLRREISSSSSAAAAAASRRGAARSAVGAKGALHGGASGLSTGRSRASAGAMSSALPATQFIKRKRKPDKQAKSKKKKMAKIPADSAPAVALSKPPTSALGGLVEYSSSGSDD